MNKEKSTNAVGETGWVSLLEVVRLLHHPNFYWGAMDGLTDCKYLTLRIDTRDCKCLVSDRKNVPVSLARIREGLENSTMPGMNENPMVTITESRAALFSDLDRIREGLKTPTATPQAGSKQP
jgi:hypothetical protein